MYEKRDNSYNFQDEDGKFIVTVTEDSIEFKIKTIKWIPGSYEPIEGSELYKCIEYHDLEGKKDEEIKAKMNSIINEITG